MPARPREHQQGCRGAWARGRGHVPDVLLETGRRNVWVHRKVRTGEGAGSHLPGLGAALSREHSGWDRQKQGAGGTGGGGLCAR